MSGDDREAPRQAPVGHRDSRRGGNRDGARDAGDDLDGQTRGLALEAFLPAASEHVGIPALEPHDAVSGAGLFDEDAVDPVLGDGVVVGAFAHVDDADVLG